MTRFVETLQGWPDWYDVGCGRPRGRRRAPRSRWRCGWKSAGQVGGGDEQAAAARGRMQDEFDDRLAARSASPRVSSCAARRITRSRLLMGPVSVGRRRRRRTATASGRAQVGAGVGPTRPEAGAGTTSGIGRPYFSMIRFVVSPSVGRPPAAGPCPGRRTMLNVAVPAACRWAISSATGSGARTM